MSNAASDDQGWADASEVRSYGRGPKASARVRRAVERISRTHVDYRMAEEMGFETVRRDAVGQALGVTTEGPAGARAEEAVQTLRRMLREAGATDDDMHAVDEGVRWIWTTEPDPVGERLRMHEERLLLWLAARIENRRK